MLVLCVTARILAVQEVTTILRHPFHAKLRQMIFNFWRGSIQHNIMVLILCCTASEVGVNSLLGSHFWWCVLMRL